MVSLRFIISFFCGTYSNICQVGHRKCEFKPCDGDTHIGGIRYDLCIVLAKGEGKGLNTLSKQNIFFLVISGIATGLSWLFYFKAMQIGNVSQVAAVDKLSLALTIMMAVLFLGESLTWKSLAGASFIIIGTVLLAWK